MKMYPPALDPLKYEQVCVPSGPMDTSYKERELFVRFTNRFISDIGAQLR